MNALKEVILFSCFVQICIRSTETQYVSFGTSGTQYVGFGFGPNLPNGSGRSMGGGSNSDVSPDLKMGQNCQIGLQCKIGSGCSMGDNVRVSNYVQIDQGSSIGSNCQLMDYSSLGAYVTMGANNFMNSYAQVKENANIGSGGIMGMYANIGPNARLEQNVYAGDYSQIGSNAVIGSNSVIQPYAEVPDNALVGPNEMVIKTPTSSQLYQNSLPMNQIPQSDIDVAVDHGQPEKLNDRVRQLVSSQKQEMESNCQGNAQGADFKPLGLAVSLYMIRCDGLDNFMQNMGQGNGASAVFSFGNIGIGELIVNGRSVFGSGTGQAAGNDKHFVEGSPHKFLKPELENDMIELLALKEDSQRSNRVADDTFCKTVSQVQNKQRKVKCDQAVDVGSPSQNGPSRPQTPNQGRGNGHLPPNNPNSNQPNKGNQQPTQPNHVFPNSNPNGNEGGNIVPNQGQLNPPTNPNNPPAPPAKRDYGQTNANEPNYSVNPNINHPSPTQGTHQPTPGYPSNSNAPSNSYAPSNPIPNSHDTGTRPNSQYPNSPQLPSYNNQPNPSQNNQPNPSQNNHPNPSQNNHLNPSQNNHPNPAQNNHPNPSQNNPQNNPPQTQPNGGNSPACNKCSIQPDTSFGNNVELGNNLNIGKGTTVGNNCQIKDSANVGDGVVIGSDSVVSENANIGNNCVLDDKAKVGPNANIGPGSYVGKNCDIGANAFVGEHSIVLDNAKVPDGGYIGQNDVVISTPTSADLYSSCAPIETVPQNLISQPDPNNNLRQVMRGQIAKVRSHCQQPNQELLDFAALASAKTLYLISLHGIPGFTENLQNIQNKRSGNYDAKAYEKLTNEEHFINNGQPSRIEPDVKGEMIVLMAIEQDFGRGNRSPDNSFCQTFLDIARNQRQVKCDK